MRPSEGRVEVECPNCGKIVERYASQVRLRGGRWCSYACRDAGRKRRPKTCAECGIEYVPGKSNGYATPRQFCSQACMGASKRKRITLSCSYCGGSFDRVNAWVTKNAGPVYCSRACQGAARVRPGSAQSRGRGWRRIAAAIRERDGRVCVRCGTVDEGRELAVDHIIPWLLVRHDEARANDPDNLASLCSSCHGVKTTVIEPRLARGDFIALTEFYGAERAARAIANAPL